MKPISEIKKAIYQLLYEKSRVDGIRYCNEDEWPIDEIANLVEEQIRKAKKEAVEDFFVYFKNKLGLSEHWQKTALGMLRNEYLESLDTTKGQP